MTEADMSSAIVGARRIHDAMHAALEVAFDAVLDVGWPVESMVIVHDNSRGSCMQLRIKEGLGSWDVPVFEVMLTCEMDASPPRVNIIERWLGKIPKPPDVVDRTALAQMFPDWPIDLGRSR